MKIYYSTNINECPFKGTEYNGTTGLDCSVGSIHCRNCSFCYGAKEGNLVGFPNLLTKRIDIRHNKYVRCSFPSYNIKYKLYHILFHLGESLKQKLKINNSRTTWH